jgi:hypothetical protein
MFLHEFQEKIFVPWRGSVKCIAVSGVKFFTSRYFVYWPDSNNYAEPKKIGLSSNIFCNFSSINFKATSFCILRVGHYSVVILQFCLLLWLGKHWKSNELVIIILVRVPYP